MPQKNIRNYEAITDSNDRIARDHKISNFIASLWQPYWNFPAFEARTSNQLTIYKKENQKFLNKYLKYMELIDYVKIEQRSSANFISGNRNTSYSVILTVK